MDQIDSLCGRFVTTIYRDQFYGHAKAKLGRLLLGFMGVIHYYGYNIWLDISLLALRLLSLSVLVRRCNLLYIDLNELWQHADPFDNGKLSRCNATEISQ